METTLLENRILPIKGGYNFRDLGTLQSKNGKIIKSNLLFRTDELSNLETEDLDLLTKLNIQTIIDFRTDVERSQSIDKIPSTCKKEIHLDILAANMNAFLEEIQNGQTNFKSLLINFYKDLVLSEQAIKEYSSFFKILEDPNNCGIIYHCTAGKDRTGVATALILSALDVEWRDILSDYLMSNEFLVKKYQSYIEKNPALKDVFLVQEDYLKTAFEVIKENYESVQNYLTNVLNVDIDKLKQIYLN
nr:tyrosine-protein phosphatase [uncultured Flavobacterium sp.]